MDENSRRLGTSASVGLTGGIASGKSTVADLLTRRGLLVVDADRLAREVVAPGTPGLRAVVERFGVDVLSAEGGLHRPRLAAQVFADPAARADLEAIIHPAVRERAAAIERAARADDPGRIVVQMIPLLVETGQQGRFGTVVVVDVPEHLQRARLSGRDGLSSDQVESRLAAQATRGQRLRAAHVVVDNSGDLPALERVADALADLLLRRWTPAA